MPLIFYTMLALVQEFLPHMLEQGDGAILTAQGGSTVRGLPNMSGPSPAQVGQRNYLQALHAEVAEKGVCVGMLYIGAAIKNSAFHAEMEKPLVCLCGTAAWLGVRRGGNAEGAGGSLSLSLDVKLADSNLSYPETVPFGSSSDLK